jgi:hypothetical protein
VIEQLQNIKLTDEVLVPKIGTTLALTSLGDLEPLGLGRVKLVARTRALGHVCIHRADAMEPQASSTSHPLERDLAAGTSLGGERRGLCAVSTGHVRRVDVRRSVVTRGGANDGWVLAAGPVALVELAVDGDTVEDAVRSGEGREGAECIEHRDGGNHS